MHPELVATFIDEFHREVNRHRAEMTLRTEGNHRYSWIIQALKMRYPAAAIPPSASNRFTASVMG